MQAQILLLVINQLNAQNVVLSEVYYKPLHVLRTMCSSSGGQNYIVQHYKLNVIAIAI